MFRYQSSRGEFEENGGLLYTSTLTPTYPLLVDTSFYSNGGTVSNVMIATGSSGGGSTQNASWTNTVGVAANGNNLTKTAAEGWGNAGAASTQTIASGDGYVELTATETNTYRMIGLSNGDSHQNYNDIDFAIYPAIGGTLYVYEGGASRGSFGSYATGDTLRVAVEGGVVKYRKNGALLYTSTLTPTYPLLVDTSFYSNGGTINNVKIGSGSGSGSGGSSAQFRWLVTDHLGTPRIIADETGSLAGIKRHDYLPFGEELLAGTGGRTIAKGYSGDAVRQKFTSKERDNETGLDYFLSRYYSATQGRFTSPDEFAGGPDELFNFSEDAADNPTFYADLDEPQSLNKYQYCYNNPLAYIDPDGHAPHDKPLLDKGMSEREAQRALDDWRERRTEGDFTRHVISKGTRTVRRAPQRRLPTVTRTGIPKNRSYLPTYPGSSPSMGAPGSLPVWGSHLSPLNDYSWLSSERFKRIVGTFPNYEWHHVVNQNPSNRARFGDARLNIVGNLIPVERSVHRRITGYYQSIDPRFSSNQRVRDWLKTKSFQEQHQFGLNVLREFGVIP